MSQKLNKILDSFENANKKDVSDYAKGHLNESHLYKLPETSIHRPWRSSIQERLTIIQSQPERQVTLTQGSKRKIAILKSKQKSLSTLPPIDQKIWVKKFSDSKTTLNVSTSNSSVSDSASQKSEKDNAEIKKSPDFLNHLYALSAPSEISWLKNLVIPSQMLGVTKKDHYISMKEFQSSVVGKLGTFDRNKITGSKMINRLLKKLEMDLKQCPPTGENSLSLKWLQCFSNSFDDLIANSPAFGNILKTIKAEYDNYISYLLDIHLTHGKILQEEIQQMSKGSVSTQLSLSQAKHKMEELESTAVTLLENTEKLQKEITEESEAVKAKSIESISEEQVEPVSSHSSGDLYHEVEELRVVILSRLDELNGMREDILANYVPVSVCHNLEQCIRETEMELQKLIKQNEYYQRSSSEMEGYLKEAIVEADTSDRDVRRIWRKIYSRKHLGESEDINKVDENQESDEDDDHESKWNWYIS